MDDPKRTQHADLGAVKDPLVSFSLPQKILWCIVTFYPKPEMCSG